MVEEPQTETVKESIDRQPLANLGQLCIESFHSPDFYPLFSPNVQHKKFANADLFFFGHKNGEKNRDNKNREFFRAVFTL